MQSATTLVSVQDERWFRFGSVLEPGGGFSRQSAKQHHRSLNSEVIRRLEQSLGATQVDPEAFLARIQALRTRAPVPPLTDALLEEAKEESRPISRRRARQ